MDAPSRNPDLYEWGPHLEDRFGDPMRFLTEDLVRETIENGRDYPNEGGDGKTRRRMEIGRSGVDVVLVLPHDSEFVVTGWTEVANYQRAVASGRWSQEDIQLINAFEEYDHDRWSPKK